jgi:hypothetical protein
MTIKQYPYKEQLIPSNLLLSPRETYQRKFSNNRANKIAKEFDERIANLPKVSYRDGKYYVFDGQHTIAARKNRNGGKDLPILCKVYFGMTPEEEAALFAQQTGISARLTAGAKFRAELCAHNPMALAFKDATESVGLQIDYDQERGKNRIGCVATARKLYAAIGPERYKEAMSILARAWDGEPDSFRAENVSSIGTFVDLYHDQYDEERLLAQLGKVDPMAIYRGGQASGLAMAGNKRYLYQVLQIYNGNSKRHSLPLKF